MKKLHVTPNTDKGHAFFKAFFKQAGKEHASKEKGRKQAGLGTFKQRTKGMGDYQDHVTREAVAARALKKKMK